MVMGAMSICSAPVKAATRRSGNAALCAHLRAAVQAGPAERAGAPPRLSVRPPDRLAHCLGQAAARACGKTAVRERRCARPAAAFQPSESKLDHRFGSAARRPRQAPVFRPDDAEERERPGAAHE